MKSFIVLTLAFAATLAVPTTPYVQQRWAEFKVTHRKEYATPIEELHRLKIFQDNLAAIEAHNEKYAKGEVTYKKGMNQFGDLTKEEFLAYVNKGKASKPQFPGKNSKPFVSSGKPKDSAVDWRNRGAVTDVKDQGKCGSGWAFSATGSIESQLSIAGRGLTSLSEQNLIDCSGGSYGNQGCDGGSMDNSFNYVHDHGIESESDYPYTGSADYCKFYDSRSVTTVNTYYDVPTGSESGLEEAVSQHGPVSVSIDATDELRFYSGGYFYDHTCNANDLNHSVLVIGYGDIDGQDIWIVKNSWGGAWGDGGYFYLARNSGNMCGIASAASYPIL